MTALKRCVHCQQPMAAAAQSCPHCGEPAHAQYAVPDYARPPQRTLVSTPPPVLEHDPTRPSPKVEELANQLSAIAGLTRQELVNLIAWRAHSMAAEQKRARQAKKQAATTRSHVTRTPKTAATRNSIPTGSIVALIGSMLVVSAVVVAQLIGDPPPWYWGVALIAMVLSSTIWMQTVLRRKN